MQINIGQVAPLLYWPRRRDSSLEVFFSRSGRLCSIIGPRKSPYQWTNLVYRWTRFAPFKPKWSKLSPATMTRRTFDPNRPQSQNAASAPHFMSSFRRWALILLWVITLDPFSRSIMEKPHSSTFMSPGNSFILDSTPYFCICLQLHHGTPPCPFTEIQQSSFRQELKG